MLTKVFSCYPSHSLQVNSNGVLSFDTPFTNCCPPRDFPLLSPPLIAPLWLDFDRTGASESGIYYRLTEDPIYLELVHILLSSVENVGDLTEFFATKLFIATWDKVPQYGGSTSVHVHFKYCYQRMVFKQCPHSSTETYRWGSGAQVGFNTGVESRRKVLSTAYRKYLTYV